MEVTLERLLEWVRKRQAEKSQEVTLCRLPEVLRKRGKRKSALYEEIRQRLFTRGVVIGDRAVAWPNYEIDAVNAARIAGCTADEIRELVARLEAARKDFGAAI